MVDTLQTTLSIFFFLMTIFAFPFNFQWSVLIRSNWWLISIGLDNGLLPNRRQAIIWTNDGIDHIDAKKYVALGLD